MNKMQVIKQEIYCASYTIKKNIWKTKIQKNYHINICAVKVYFCSKYVDKCCFLK